MSPAEPLLTSNEVAAWLRLPKATLETWRWKGVGPTYLKVGRYVRYRRGDVEEWLQTVETVEILRGNP